MDDLRILTKTPAADLWLRRAGPTDDLPRRALLSTVDGRRNVVELESLARAMGLDARAIDELVDLGLIRQGRDGGTADPRH